MPKIMKNVYENDSNHTEFFQLIRLWQKASSSSIKKLSKPSQETVRFKTNPKHCHSPTQLQNIIQLPNNILEITVNHLGLTGYRGTLPTPYNETLLLELHQNQTRFNDFLNIFNHRLISLHYQTWEKSRLDIDDERTRIKNKNKSPLQEILSSLAGSKTSHKYHYFFAGLIRQKPINATNLTTILKHYFELPCYITEYVSAWCSVENPKNIPGKSILGKSILGSHYFALDAKIYITLGPLTYAQYKSLLPNQSKIHDYKKVILSLLGHHPAFDIRLELLADEIPACQLSCFTLGFDTWLSHSKTHNTITLTTSSKQQKKVT